MSKEVKDEAALLPPERIWIERYSNPSERGEPQYYITSEHVQTYGHGIEYVRADAQAELIKKMRSEIAAMTRMLSDDGYVAMELAKENQ